MRVWVFFILFLALTAAATPARFTVLHTNDLHSHFEGEGPDRYQNTRYARLAHLIRELRSKRENVLLVDAGDFFSGTLFHLLGPNPNMPSAPELEFFRDLKYDALTFGNHEFDAAEEGLETMLEKSKDFYLPFVATNLRIEGQYPLLSHVPKSRLLKVGGVVFGFVGFLGLDAARSSSGMRSSAHFVGYEDSNASREMSALISLAENEAAALRSKGAQVIIALIHGGHPEDEALAKASGVDMVISGHTHQKYFVPPSAGSAAISQAGRFGDTLGELDWEYDGKLKLLGQAFYSVDASEKIDATTQSHIQKYKKEIDRVLKPFGQSYNTPVVQRTEPLVRTFEPQSPMGIEVVSEILSEINRRIEPRADIYLTTMSLIRGDLPLNDGKPTLFQFSDVFRMLPVGFREKFLPSSPLVHFWLSKSDVRSMLEFLEFYRFFSPNFTPVYSDSVRFRVRRWGIPLWNRIADLKIGGKPLSEGPDYYQIATTQYVANFIPKLPILSHGFLRLTPRDEKGKPLEHALELPLPGEPFLLSDGWKNGMIK